ncbi:MAG: trypsin-like peptidase domain-containing protein [Gemmataceae bacterium]
MAVSVSCPGCANSFTISDDLLGKKVRCKSCQEVFVAMGVKVAAGAKGGDERIQARVPAGKTRVNGKANGDATLQAKAKSQAGMSGGTKLAIAGGALAFVVMAAVTGWAVMGRGGDTKNTQVAANTSSTSTPKINLNDTPPVDTSDKPVEQPKAKAPVTTTPVEKPRTGPAKFVEQSARRPVRIEPATIDKVKKSSGWIKIAFLGTGATGSGWFAEPGILMTNSHVVGMKEPAEAPPDWIKVVLDSGQPTERTFDAKLLGLDRDNDLAALKIEGDNLPPPMPIARSSELREGDVLYTIGFPRPQDILGVAAGIFNDAKVSDFVHTVKSRETHVTGRFPYPNGSVKYIQGEGGSDPGNSGGMIVDSAGQVRLMVVAGFGSEQIELFIPSEYVIYFLQGRILKVIPAQAYETNGKVRQMLTAMVADPMKRIKHISLEMWTGSPDRKMRPASESAPSPLPGDSPRQSVELAYDANTKVPIGEAIEAKGEWDVIPLKDGQVYWVQPHYTGMDGSERWGEAVPLPMGGIPVQKKPATLALKHTANTERNLEIDSHMGLGVSPEFGELHIQGNHVISRMTEKTISVQPDGAAKMKLSFNKLKFKDHDDEQEFRRSYRGVLESISNVSTELTLTKNGAIRTPRPDLKKVPVLARSLADDFNRQTIQSLEAFGLSLPDRVVQPGETWKCDVNQAIVFPVGRGITLTENGLFNMVCRYDGVRTREGREEAVIEFEGKIAREGDSVTKLPDTIDPSAKAGATKDKVPQGRGMHGYVRGAALVDLQTGAVSLGSSVSEMEFHVEYLQQKIKFGAALRVNLNREVAPGALAWSRERLLPNHELIVTPFVGAPDITLSAAP